MIYVCTSRFADSSAGGVCSLSNILLTDWPRSINQLRACWQTLRRGFHCGEYDIS